MTIQEFSKARKELNTTYSIELENGQTKAVELTSKAREEGKEKGAKTLFSGTIDGETFTDLYITKLCNLIKGRTPRTISEGTAAKRNLTPITAYKSNSAFDACYKAAKRFSELEKELNELRAKYHFANETAPLANAALSLPHYKAYSLRIERIKAVCARYKAMQANYIEHLRKAVEKAQNTQKEWLSTNWLELTKKAGQQKAAELQKVVDTARAELDKANGRTYLTDSDIYKRYGIDL